MLLDENMDSIHAVLKAHALDVGDVLVFKIGRLGGITKLKQVRNGVGIVKMLHTNIQNFVPFH